jgi:trehalose 6-phosphate phosphatase
VEFRTADGRQRYDDVVAVASATVVCLDFDGVLSPIVDDPTRAFIHPDAHDVLTALLGTFRAVAVVTGRPAEQVRELGRFDDLADEAGSGVLLVRGQYGNERWDSTDRTTQRADPPEGLAAFQDELSDLLAEARADAAFVEDKGLAVALHTRRLQDPQAAFERLTPVLERAADEHGLVLEPGKLVVEVRAPGMHKGLAVRALQEELEPKAMVYVGDDLGDVEAFEAVTALRAEGITGLLVCSGSEEQQSLVELSDLVVDGPDGVMAFLRELGTDAAGH